jgi:hypothetical protein
MASAGLKAVADHRLLGLVSIRSLFKASEQIGRGAARLLPRETGEDSIHLRPQPVKE